MHPRVDRRAECAKDMAPVLAVGGFTRAWPTRINGQAVLAPVFNLSFAKSFLRARFGKRGLGMCW